MLLTSSEDDIQTYKLRKVTAAVQSTIYVHAAFKFIGGEGWGISILTPVGDTGEPMVGIADEVS